MSDVLTLTREMVNIESSNPGTYENAMANFVEQWLKDAGAEVLRDELEERPGRYNVVAKILGETDDPGLVYICHMDTVPLNRNAWHSDPLSGEIRDGNLYGCGSADMKGGLASCMVAFRNILKQNKPLKHSFSLIATSDEEDEMVGAEQAIRSGRVSEKSWILTTEPSGGDLQMAHKGKTWFRITVNGKSAHSSVPWTGIDSIGAAAEILSSLRQKIDKLPVDPLLGPTTITLGEIHGGNNINIVADKCTFSVDMRLAPPVTSDMSVQIMQEAIAEGLSKVPGATCECNITSKRPYVTGNSESFLRAQIQECHQEVFGKPLPESICGAYTDTAVIAGTNGNRECAVYSRISSATVHKPDEYASCESIEETARFVTRLAEKILL